MDNISLVGYRTEDQAKPFRALAYNRLTYKSFVIGDYETAEQRERLSPIAFLKKKSNPSSEFKKFMNEVPAMPMPEVFEEINYIAVPHWLSFFESMSNDKLRKLAIEIKTIGDSDRPSKVRKSNDIKLLFLIHGYTNFHDQYHEAKRLIEVEILHRFRKGTL